MADVYMIYTRLSYIHHIYILVYHIYIRHYILYTHGGCIYDVYTIDVCIASRCMADVYMIYVCIAPLYQLYDDRRVHIG